MAKNLLKRLGGEKQKDLCTLQQYDLHSFGLVEDENREALHVLCEWKHRTQKYKQNSFLELDETCKKFVELAIYLSPLILWGLSLRGEKDIKIKMKIPN